MSIQPNVIDINHANPINFSQIVAAGIWGVIHKSRQGLGFGDPLYRKRMEAAKVANLLFGAYDFATSDHVAQNVDAFLGYSALSSADMAFLDFEDNSQSQMSGDQAYEFLDRVSQKRGRPCGIYGGNRIREHIDQNDSKWIDVAKTAPLWQCRYIGSQPADNADLFAAIPPIPPWTSNFIIQYSGDGVGPRPHTIPGLQDGADLDVFNGTRSQLTVLWAGATSSETAPTS